MFYAFQKLDLVTIKNEDNQIVASLNVKECVDKILYCDDKKMIYLLYDDNKVQGFSTLDSIMIFSKKFKIEVDIFLWCTDLLIINLETLQMKLFSNRGKQIPYSRFPQPSNRTYEFQCATVCQNNVFVILVSDIALPHCSQCWFFSRACGEKRTRCELPWCWYKLMHKNLMDFIEIQNHLYLYSKESKIMIRIDCYDKENKEEEEEEDSRIHNIYGSMCDIRKNIYFGYRIFDLKIASCFVSTNRDDVTYTIMDFDWENKCENQLENKVSSYKIKLPSYEAEEKDTFFPLPKDKNPAIIRLFNSNKPPIDRSYILDINKKIWKICFSKSIVDATIDIHYTILAKNPDMFMVCE